MKIVGLDISKSATGVAVGRAEEPPRTFRASFGGATLGQTGAAFDRWMRDLLILEEPGLVVIEAPFVSAARGSAETARLLLTLAGTAAIACARRKIESQEVASQTWRKAILGTGRPPNPKAAALSFCERAGWNCGRDDNRAEAACVWAFGHFQWGQSREITKKLSTMSVDRMAGR